MEAPKVIHESNLSYAWARAYLMVIENQVNPLMPLTISIDGFADNLPSEDSRIRYALDSALEECGKYKSAISGMVIFPFKSWNHMGRPSCKEFSKWYLDKYLPRLRARDPRNRLGTYFERMIAFQGVRRKGKIINKTINQLDYILNLWPQNGEHARPRQSALQVTCFDPVKDHNGSPRSGFPCLQQISFLYDDNGGLTVNAFYPTQYIFDRAYGNYLGLCHLGHFMASEMGLEIVRFNCFIGRPELSGTISKTKLSELTEIVRQVLPRADEDD